MSTSVRIGVESGVVAAIAATMVVVGQDGPSEQSAAAPTGDRIGAPVAERQGVGPGVWVVASRQMQMGRKLRIYDRRRGRLQ